MSSDLIIAPDSSSSILYYCSHSLAIVLIYPAILRYSAISIFALYYIHTCSFIRVLLRLVLERIDGNLLLEDLENLLFVYGDIVRCMRSIDEHFSQPVFLTVFFTMTGSFWGGYRIVFDSGMTKGVLNKSGSEMTPRGIERFVRTNGYGRIEKSVCQKKRLRFTNPTAVSLRGDRREYHQPINRASSLLPPVYSEAWAKGIPRIPFSSLRDAAHGKHAGRKTNVVSQNK
ncbi:hypothetical protein TNCV_2083121 [Trichonephila clavipes]|nr:hypothetical protein TNCV_2083121 [Trichonephila clavipes]